jgi:hypothetical protein
MAELFALKRLSLGDTKKRSELDNGRAEIDLDLKKLILVICLFVIYEASLLLKSQNIGPGMRFTRRAHCTVNFKCDIHWRRPVIHMNAA